MAHILVIGGGPAGLRAAEVASAAGAEVSLCDQKPSFGRKFLVAGKGGLNLTHSEDLERFATRYSGSDMPEGFWAEALREFDNQAIRNWASQLGIETFVASSGRVYPKSLKGAPLLRAWLKRLAEQGVVPKTRHRLIALNSESATFDTPQGEVVIQADAIILALGGGSWKRTGSDGAWTKILQELSIPIQPLVSANCGWEVNWPKEIISQIEGQPLKNITVSAENKTVRGEIMLTRYGLEGGTIYSLGETLRGMPRPSIHIDLKPTFESQQLARKMESVKRDFINQACVRLKLPIAAGYLLKALEPSPSSIDEVVQLIKAFPVSLLKPRPIDEAISSAGGVKWKALNSHLMLQNMPSIFVAGEMIDWEAPTGGYLLQGCFVSGTIAGEAALEWASKPQRSNV